MGEGENPSQSKSEMPTAEEVRNALKESNDGKEPTD